MILEAQPILQAHALLGEGALWHPTEQKLYWVDIMKNELHIFDPESGEDRCIPTGEHVGTVVPMKNNEVLLGLQTGIHRMNIRTGVITRIKNPLPGPPVRFNDGKCDPSGRFWIGSMSMDGARGTCKLYRFDGDGSLHEMLHKVSISNGIVWTADKKTMYYNDTPTSTVQAFDYDDQTGAISSPRIAFSIPESEGFPDGMSIDSEDKLWIAMWGTGRVNRYDPLHGSLLQTIYVSAPHTSSCAFGGKDLKTLYITSARAELDDESLVRFPESGDLFAIEVDVAGVPANFFQASFEH